MNEVNSKITDEVMVWQNIYGKEPVPYKISELRMSNIQSINKKIKDLYSCVEKSSRVYQNTNENLDHVKIVEYNSIARKCFDNVCVGDKYNSCDTEIWKNCDYFTSIQEIKKYRDVVIQVSNFGRVRKIESNNISILKQNDIEPGRGELYVPDFWKSLRVWTLVAYTWLSKDDNQSESLGRWHVHHISNNGYDNRPENLIWLREKIHLNYVHGN
jgi:hypothetical protein